MDDEEMRSWKREECREMKQGMARMPGPVADGKSRLTGAEYGLGTYLLRGPPRGVDRFPLLYFGSCCQLKIHHPIPSHSHGDRQWDVIARSTANLPNITGILW